MKLKDIEVKIELDRIEDGHKYYEITLKHENLPEDFIMQKPVPLMYWDIGSYSKAVIIMELGSGLTTGVHAAFNFIPDLGEACEIVKEKLEALK